MLPKLECFYKKFLLPELALPRYGTYTGIRQPKSPWFKRKEINNVNGKQARTKGTGAQEPVQGNLCGQDCIPGPSVSHTTKPTPQIIGKEINNVNGKQTRKKGAGAQKSVQGNSCDEDCKPGPSVSHTTKPTPRVLSTYTRSRRSKVVKFAGREIVHKWVVDEKKKKTKWFNGTVLDVISGKDGEDKAVYEVLYRGEETPHEVDGLSTELAEGSLRKIQFLDGLFTKMYL